MRAFDAARRRSAAIRSGRRCSNSAGDLEELKRRLVVGHKRDGRSVYDEKAKSELVALCLQPGASVSRLEAQLGTRLLERTTRQLRLTDAGESLYRDISRPFAQLRERAVDALAPSGHARATA